MAWTGQAPAVGDLVWCWFPHLPDKAPGPKPRPALVITVEVREDGVVATVVYGTAQGVGRLRAGEFAITKLANPVAYELAGLSFDTKFNFKASVALPWQETFFKVPPRPRLGQTPKLGTLHPSLLRAVEAAFRASTRERIISR